MSFLHKIKDKINTGNTLFYPGCLTQYKAPEWQENYEKILKKANVEFIVIDTLNCCGSPALNAGDKNIFKNLAEKNLEDLKKYSITKIITGCPACYKIFAKDYKEILGDKWDIEVQHITQVLASKLKDGVIKIKKLDVSVTYHDPCHLGRHMGVYEDPRYILQQITDDFREMKLNKNWAFCCGGGGGVATNFNQNANKIAKERVGQAEETNAELLVSTCPMCTKHLGNNTKKLKAVEISELILKALEINE